EAGIDSRKLILTAAVKNSALFKLAAQHNIAVVLDNDDELQLAQNTAQSAGTMLEINIRLSGFHCDGKKCKSALVLISIASLISSGIYLQAIQIFIIQVFISTLMDMT